eukprot:213363_1
MGGFASCCGSDVQDLEINTEIAAQNKTNQEQHIALNQSIASNDSDKQHDELLGDLNKYKESEQKQRKECNEYKQQNTKLVQKQEEFQHQIIELSQIINELKSKPAAAQEETELQLMDLRAKLAATQKENELLKQQLIDEYVQPTPSPITPVDVEGVIMKKYKSHYVSITSSEEISIYTVPTKTIAIAPVIANHILLNEKFIQIRKKMEANACKLDDIDKVLYRRDFWLIQGSEAIALEEHRQLFDIVVWKIATIPAFAHFEDEEAFYEKVFGGTQPWVNTEGIWSVLSKEKFIQMFDVELLKEIDSINDETHSYLEDKTLVDQLKVIERWKKANDIIIVGQKTCVRDLLRVIRQEEVQHASMLSMFKMTNKGVFDWESNAPDPTVIVSYWCIVSNLPLQSGQQELHQTLLDSEYSRWTCAEIVQGNWREAKIEFDDDKCLQCFMEDVQRGDVLFGGHKLCIKSHQKETKPRKMRRFHGGHMFM